MAALAYPGIPPAIGMSEMKRNASQKNAPKGGENFRVARSGSGDAGAGGRGGISKVIGPKTATRTIGNSGLAREHVGPKNAPYMDKGTY